MLRHLAPTLVHPQYSDDEATLVHPQYGDDEAPDTYASPPSVRWWCGAAIVGVAGVPRLVSYEP